MRQKARVNLICARKDKQYTQAELASKLNITERQYQRLEAGTSKGSIDVWVKLKDILRAETIDWLIKQSE